jgi:A/G-specific adenine glycosylase
VNRYITDLLLPWYEVNRRKLPWRENIHPYTTWVSEIMAQQTRIAQLLPFYEGFISRFPDVYTLAAADIDEVLTQWAGMGYYARARNLHESAKIIAQNGFPTSRDAWRKLPGIGDYTAGAIASITRGERVAATDGNALRVYARLNNDSRDIKTSAVKKSAVAFFENNLPESADDMGQYTQAIMELGALVCVPKHPKCTNCPLQNLCEGYKQGTVNNLPVRTAKKPSPVIDMTVLMIINPRHQVLTQKRDKGLVKGMFVYYLYEGVCEPVETVAQLGFTVIDVLPVGCAKHVFTHRVWQMTGYAVYIAESSAPEGFRFMSKDEIKTAPFPAAVKYYTNWFIRT